MFGTSESYPILAWRYWNSFFGGDPVISGVILCVIVACTAIVISKFSFE